MATWVRPISLGHQQVVMEKMMMMAKGKGSTLGLQQEVTMKGTGKEKEGIYQEQQQEVMGKRLEQGHQGLQQEQETEKEWYQEQQQGREGLVGSRVWEDRSCQETECEEEASPLAVQGSRSTPRKGGERATMEGKTMPE